MTGLLRGAGGRGGRGGKEGRGGRENEKERKKDRGEERTQQCTLYNIKTSRFQIF
jgi:hypothetical protein